MDDSFYQGADTLDSVTIAYKYKHRFLHFLPFFCLALIPIGVVCLLFCCFSAWLYYSFGDEIYGFVATPCDYSPVLYISAFITGLFALIIFFNASRMATEYNITFNHFGISGTYKNFYFSGIDFVETVIVRGRNNHIEYYLCDIERIDGINYISWENFKSFSRYDDFIILWRDDVPPNGLATKFLMMFDVGILFNRKTFPLKIRGTRADLANLQDYLSQRLSQARPVCAEVKRFA